MFASGFGHAIKPIRLLLFAAIAISLAGCGSASTPPPPSDLQMKADIYDIEQIEVVFHKASSQHDVDLMMTLYADNATLTVGPNTYTGKDQIREFFATKSGPFKPENDWVSETPAYKIRVTLEGDKGTLYFECHYVDRATRQVVAVVGADQNVARINGKWLITTLIAATPEL